MTARRFEPAMHIRNPWGWKERHPKQKASLDLRERTKRNFYD
jgi:hypothetical protein